MKDYEQLYYDEVYKNKELIQKIKELEEENRLLKRYSKCSDVKEIIIRELLRYKKEVRRNKYEKNDLSKR